LGKRKFIVCGALYSLTGFKRGEAKFPPSLPPFSTQNFQTA